MFKLRLSRPTCLFAFFFHIFQSFGAVSDTIPRLYRPGSSVNILAVGDWGQGGSLGQRKVATKMAEAARQLPVSFIISTGDNFYPAGVSDTNSIYWKRNFEEVYSDSSLQVRWYVVAGNHDHLLGIRPQIDYTWKSQRWYMPSRYYSATVAVGTDSLLMVFLDTEPIERMLRHKAPDSLVYQPSAVDGQIKWLAEVLASSHAKYRMVIGHHPLHTGGARRHNSRPKKLRALLEPILTRNNVDVYLSGHEHQLEFLKAKGPTYFVISGAGSESRHVGWFKRFRLFAARRKGFVVLSFNHQGWEIQFISSKKNLLYKKMIVK